ncbi:hypothetical protein R1sor_018616 [Riccia sorocarpa]|uniref:Myb-like domain-containing protein n=1 Tax=Riccia sorocarpa TaxID=122646 RepID=A0ABD3IGF3_9MARC
MDFLEETKIGKDESASGRLEEGKKAQVEIMPMEESEGEVATEETLLDCGAGEGGNVDECVDSSGLHDEPQRKKRRHFGEGDFSGGLSNSLEYDGSLRRETVSRDGQVDYQQRQQPNLSSSDEICALEYEVGEDEIAENGEPTESQGLQIQIPNTTILFPDTIAVGNGSIEVEDDDIRQRELIPEFDPEENGNSLFTDELRAAVEEGTELQLPLVMSAGNEPRLSADEAQLLVISNHDTKEIASEGLPLLPAAPSANGAHEMDTGNLEVMGLKLYAALQQQQQEGSSYLPAADPTHTARSHDQFHQQCLDQEHSEDKNPIGLDEGERTPRHPRWTKDETAVLVTGKGKCDEEFRKPQSGSKFTTATERWDFISEYCKAHGVDRDAHQCRKRWSNLAADFKKIRNWHKQSGVEPYWSMRGDSRRKNKLPGSFDPEVYADMEAASDSNISFKKRKVIPPVIAENGGEHEDDPLASVLESSGRAMQAALAKNIQAQIEAHNQNSELDRVQRKEQSDSLVGVLGLLAESLARIAEKI